MNRKSIDNKTLTALKIMSEDTCEGVNSQVFIKQKIMKNVSNLIKEDYALKIELGKNNFNYCLTQKGLKYLKENILYAK